MKRIAIMAVVLIAVVPASASFAIGLSTSTDNTEVTPVAAPTVDSFVSMASYHGRTIDLRKGWGTAAACYVAETGTSCFDSEKEMDAFIDESLPKGTSGLKSSARAVCGSTLRLYDLTSYGGGVVAFSLRFTVIDTASVGFNNRTSSYKVGACSVVMWDGAGGTGAVYTGPMGAGVVASTMIPFWDNRIGSIYIN
jgi:hypothetical protein